MVEKVQINERLRAVLIFLVKLIFLALPLYIIIWLSVDFTLVQSIVATQTSIALRLLGFDVNQTGLILELGKISLIIDQDCTGWKASLFLIALILATPAPLRKKMIGISLFLPLLYMLNLGRIISIAVIGIFFGPGPFQLFHLMVWQPLLILLVLGLWFAWFKIYIKSGAIIYYGEGARKTIRRN